MSIDYTKNSGENARRGARFQISFQDRPIIDAGLQQIKSLRINDLSDSGEKYYRRFAAEMRLPLRTIIKPADKTIGFEWTRDSASVLPR